MDLPRYVGTILVILLQLVGSSCRRCMKNEDIGWRKGNIYRCDDPDYSECCEIDREFVCCEMNSAKNLREQLHLWGTVSAFALAMFLLYIYFRHDSLSVAGTTLTGSWQAVKSKFSRRKGFNLHHDQYKERAPIGEI